MQVNFTGLCDGAASEEALEVASIDEAIAIVVDTVFADFHLRVVAGLRDALRDEF